MATRWIVPRAPAAAALVLASGCLTPAPRRLAPSASPELRPEVFFSGRTRGEGTLAVRGRPAQTLRVEGRGRTEGDGSFRLDQTVTMGAGSVETRSWHLRRVDARTYTATLSDAQGPVAAEVEGNRLHLRYALRKPGVVMEQWLYLQPDGVTVRNVATITVLGVPWARLLESITRGA